MWIRGYYVTINGTVISFRNHAGKPSYVEIYLANFNTRAQCEEFFEDKVLTQLVTK